MDGKMRLRHFPILIFPFGILLLYAALVVSVLYFCKGETFLEILFSKRTMFSIYLSLFTASAATLLSILIGIPSAYALSRMDFYGKQLVDTILEFPMFVSPAALGAMLLIFFNTPLGEATQMGPRFVFEPSGIILAQFVTTLGVATKLIKVAMDEIPRRYEEVARSLGASPVKAFFTITLPLAKRGILASAILTWAKALGEFGATITVAGSMAMKTETLPIAIFMRLSTADIEGTVVLISVLIAISLSILFGVRLIFRKSLYA
jgi:molybdate transport system permease protein